MKSFFALVTPFDPSAHPDQGLPKPQPPTGQPPRPDQGLPGPQPTPTPPEWQLPHPENPIYWPLPPGAPVYPDIGLPGDQPHPDQGLPGSQPKPDNTLPGSQPKPDQGLPGPAADHCAIGRDVARASRPDQTGARVHFRYFASVHHAGLVLPDDRLPVDVSNRISHDHSPGSAGMDLLLRVERVGRPAWRSLMRTCRVVRWRIRWLLA
jgi:hypothetical protein